jgi:diguanylate cyclase (GGDEF)-like protein
MGKIHSFRSIRFKVGLSYLLLSIISIGIFSWVISLNQLELISNNSRYQVKELISSTVNSLHKMPMPSEASSLNAKDQTVALVSLGEMLTRLLPNFVIYQDSARIMASSATMILPKGYKEQTSKARALERNSGVEYHLLLSQDRRFIEVYIPLDQIGLKDKTIYSKISLDEIGTQYRDLYKQIFLTVIGLTLLHAFFGLFLFRLLVSPILAMRTATERISKGDYSAKVTVFSQDELGSLAEGFNHMSGALQENFLRLQSQMDQLQNAQSRIENMARTDELTGLFNRRHFFDFLAKHISQSSRYGSPLGLILLDVDHFKKVNDNHGHLCGDKVLREMGATLLQLVRPSDVLARYGGEEIVLLLPETNLAQGLCVAEKIRKAIMAMRFELPTGGLLPITVSLGVAEIHDALRGAPVESTDLQVAFIECADKALYLAKKAGRNQAVAYKPGVEQK